MKVSELLTIAIPIVPETEKAQYAIALLHDREFEEYDHVYLVDGERHLRGQVPLKSLIRARPDAALLGSERQVSGRSFRR